MGRKRSAPDCLNLEIYAQAFVGFVLIFASQVLRGYTSPGDVTAINNLYAALGGPLLPGWVSSGGDPCYEAWQGVSCNGSNIISIILNGANLGGGLSDSLGTFASIQVIDLSNNQIGGNIPSSLPLTLRNFFLAANQFTGSIPTSLSELSLLTDMSLNYNLLTGEIPDAFQALFDLINLDLSHNNLSGPLPPSIENLSSITTLRLQNNQLSGTLDVLQDLPLKDLNVENNLFSGPIPEKLLNIPNFRKDGNPFGNSTNPMLAPTSPMTPPSPPPPVSGSPSSNQSSVKPVDGPSATEESNSSGKGKGLRTKRIIWISITVILVFIILVLALVLLVKWCYRDKEDSDWMSKQNQAGPYKGTRPSLRDNASLEQQSNQIEKVPIGAVATPKPEHQEMVRTGLAPKPQNEQYRHRERIFAIPKQDSHEIDIMLMPPPPPPPPPPLPFEKVIVNPIGPVDVNTEKPSMKTLNLPVSARSFTIASLQQYTNSFSQENLIGSGMLGTVYRAQLPEGKLLAVKKLDKKISNQQDDDEFFDLVNSIDKIRHANVVELMGYCAEHGERLFIYEYCSEGTLHDALHLDDEFKKKLSWTARVRMALGAARALKYLHEVCHPPIVHRNFKSANVLLDDDLSVRVSDCGLAPLLSRASVSQLSGRLSAYGYEAPELESGIFTLKSDVYSFGAVMLELLTGRKSYDSKRNRGEKMLVAWAIHQLHDIDALSRMVDPLLNGEYPAKSLSRFADIISRCVQTEPEFRPQMSEVVDDLVDMIRKEAPNRSNSD